MDSELIYWIWLAMAFGTANPVKWNIMAKFESPKAAYEAIVSEKNGLVLPTNCKGAKNFPLQKAEKVIEYCRSKSIDIYCFGDDSYPERLKEIYNPPAVLFAKGNFEGIGDSVVISCVGTRTPSEYSVRITDKLCRELSDSGVIIASGVAVGLDSVAVMAALKTGGRAVCVYPCGLEYNGCPSEISPKENEAAKRLIIERGGAIISECLPDEKTTQMSFRARNRILSGISLGTLITQAGENSGALSTAGFALAQGRDIFCIPPHELYNDGYSGVVSLLRDGAIPVFDSRDILNEYYSVYSHRLNRNSEALKIKSSSLFTQSDGKSGAKIRKPSKTDVEKENNKKRQAKVIDTEGMPKEKKKIIDFVSKNGVVLFDEIAQCFSEIDDLETLLTELELDGIITSLSGNRYTI